MYSLGHVSPLGLSLGFVALRQQGAWNRPPDSQLGIIPTQRELGFSLVVGGLLVVEDGLVTEHEMAETVLGRNQDLQAVRLGNREGLPLPIGRAAFIPVHDDDIDSSDQAGDQFPGDAIAVQPPEDVPGRAGHVILDELRVDARLPIKLFVVEFHVAAAEILEDRGRTDEQHAGQFRLGDFHGRIFRAGWVTAAGAAARRPASANRRRDFQIAGDAAGGFPPGPASRVPEAASDSRPDICGACDT